MNRRTLKKHCARARQILIEKHRYAEDSFVRADGDECLYAPPSMERRFLSHGTFLDPGPLKGTWLLYEKTSYEYNEWDYALPSQVLREIELWANLSEADVRALMAQAAAPAQSKGESA